MDEETNPIENDAVTELQRLLELYKYGKDELDENFASHQQLRSLIVKEILAKGINHAGEKMGALAIKTLAEMDKLELAKKRLKQDADNGAAMADLVSALASKMLAHDHDVDLTSAKNKTGDRIEVPDPTEGEEYDLSEMVTGCDISADSLDEILEGLGNDS